MALFDARTGGRGGAPAAIGLTAGILYNQARSFPAAMREAIIQGGTEMTQNPPSQEIQQQAGKILSQVAGYAGVKTMEIGLQSGLFEEIAKHPQGVTADQLAKQRGFDSSYTEVWCRSAYAAEVLNLGENQAYRLAPHMETLLLDQDFSGYVGGLPVLFTQREMFDGLAENLASGKRIWWD